MVPTKPSGVTSVDASPPGVSFESTIIQEGPSSGSVSQPENAYGSGQLTS